MSVQIPIIRSPAKFRRMKEANGLLGDHQALARQYEADGYLFFRGVLDFGSIARLRSEYAKELSKQGMIEDGDEDFRFTGVDLSNVRAAGGALLPVDDMHRREPWRAWATHPTTHRLISDLIGDEPFWMPIVEYKAVPPGKPVETRFNFVHQDSFYNKGIKFRTCWVPLSNIDADAGGIACAEGMHTTTHHDANNPPAYFIPSGAIPDDAWVRADYRPGDLLMMHPGLPHSGLTNHSDGFRLSMDVRCVRQSDNPPVVGQLTSITRDRVVIEGDDGRHGDFVVDEETTFRDYGLGLVDRDTAPGLYLPGDEMIVAMEDGHATIIRRTSAAAYLKEVSGH